MDRGRALSLAPLLGCLLAFASTLVLGPADAAAAHLRPYVVNGATTPIVDAPFQVALYDPELVDPEAPNDLLGAQFCGGVIRDATHVITAAHCVTFEGAEAAAPGEIEVLAGSANIEEPNAEAGSIRDPVTVTSFDPDWSSLTGEHDVGVLTLEKPLWTGSAPVIDGASTKIAPIPFAPSQPTVGSSATVSGWGFDKALLPGQEPSSSELIQGFPATLQSAELSTLSPAECAADYEEEQLANGDFICANGPGPPVADACFGDSGGPLFSGAPGSPADELLGLVDFGVGCAQPEFPGVFQSLASSENRQFASSDPPQAPRDLTEPTIAGRLEAGQAAICQMGGWLGDSIEFHYVFFRDESSALHPLAIRALTGLTSSPNYTIQAADVGQRIFCLVQGRNAGGVATTISDDASIPLPPPLGALPMPAIPQPPGKAEPARLPPSLRVLSARCARGVCTVIVRAGKGAGQAPVGKVEAKLSFLRKVRCRKHGRRASCVRRITRRVGARPLAPGRFSIIATGLSPGSYTVALVAIDSAGVRQTHATKVALVLRPSHRRR